MERVLKPFPSWNGFRSMEEDSPPVVIQKRPPGVRRRTRSTGSLREYFLFYFFGDYIHN